MDANPKFSFLPTYCPSPVYNCQIMIIIIKMKSLESFSRPYFRSGLEGLPAVLRAKGYVRSVPPLPTRPLFLFAPTTAEDGKEEKMGSCQPALPHTPSRDPIRCFTLTK